MKARHIELSIFLVRVTVVSVLITLTMEPREAEYIRLHFSVIQGNFTNSVIVWSW